MSDQTCPQCGQPLKDGELCPNCLLNLAVGSPTHLANDLSGVNVTSACDLNGAFLEPQGSESGIRWAIIR